VFYALLLIAEKAFGCIRNAVLGHSYLILVTVVGFVFFEAPTLFLAFSKLSVMLGMGAGLYDATALTYLFDYAPFLLLSILAATPLVQRLLDALRENTSRAFVKAALTPAALVIALAFLVGASSHPFLYFRF
jgi:hypothetical protein